MNIVKRQEGIKAFTSADENDLFRGVAATAASGKFVLTLFYSSRKKDAKYYRYNGFTVLYVSRPSRKAVITAQPLKLPMKNQ